MVSISEAMDEVADPVPNTAPMYRVGHGSTHPVKLRLLCFYI